MHVQAEVPEGSPSLRPPNQEQQVIYNGMPAADLPSSVTWRKARASNPSGNCVELAALPDGAGIGMRNSRDPNGPVLVYTPEEIAAFLAGARDGEFDNFAR